MDKFIGRHILPELTHKEIDNLTAHNVLINFNWQLKTST